MTTIKLDFDQKNDYRMILLKRIHILKLLNIPISETEVSATKKGWHVRLKTEKRLTDMETVCIQSILGSDFRREALNMKRIQSNQKNWNTLFSVKYKGTIYENGILKKKETSREVYDKGRSKRLLRRLKR